MPMIDVVDSGATLLESPGRDPSTLKGQEELRALWRWVGEQCDGSSEGARAHG
jgi:hypothetical protein